MEVICIDNQEGIYKESLNKNNNAPFKKIFLFTKNGLEKSKPFLFFCFLFYSSSPVCSLIRPPRTISSTFPARSSCPGLWTCTCTAATERITWTEPPRLFRRRQGAPWREERPLFIPPHCARRWTRWKEYLRFSAG